MYDKAIFNHSALSAQINRQKKYAWDLQKDIHWAQGIQSNAYLLPIDEQAIAFPNASAEQKLALSQLLGLIINSTVSEAESVIQKLKFIAWDKTLKQYPVNPEMRELGELFFEEEAKHAEAFTQYNKQFCNERGIEYEKMELLLPKAFGSQFLNQIIRNAKKGGSAFWWVTAAVEEVSIIIHREMIKHKDNIDPLYFELHEKHMEEESRHHNYAFMMLEIYHQKNGREFFNVLPQADLLRAQAFTITWVLSELTKVFEAKRFKEDHEFFNIISSCLPLFEKNSKWGFLKSLFVSSPYVSLILNNHFHQKSAKSANRHRELSFPLPHPKKVATFSC